MHAAVVTSFDAPPQYCDYPEPVARGGDEVVAAGLHPRVRSQASGSPDTSTDELPLVPGIDGVVRDPKGRIRYTVLDDTVLGTMAERTVIDLQRSVVLPDGIDPVQIAAAMNPVMSSWVALRRRIDFGRRQRVLILGATGNAGRMAIQVAKRFCTTDLARDRLGRRPNGTDPLRGAALRSTRLQIVGSGIGSVPGRDFVKELPKLVSAVTHGDFDVRARAIPLAEVEHVWTATAGMSDRIVLVP
ncbi:zinc-binding alcohol dehydrogenase family protein [Streptomyces sp. Qhu-G9]|uniref:zinc-binding alcohol dehydrogenase family protein n=1 Tax=Streptomyces sp. Qhu-G9 TaxID=3452799 RepID=UPI0022AC63F2|nr:zinc-binding alcohol dehydrogenase family protein [Streptomyces aurantiacus]WAU82538.1 zinc-binding alcohol dehydrogenase family protein [Streptomyces aurantiacus]